MHKIISNNHYLIHEQILEAKDSEETLEKSIAWREENEFCRLAGCAPLTRRFSPSTRGRWRTMRVSRSRTSRADVPGPEPRAEACSGWQEVAKPRRKWWTARGGSTFASWRSRTETVTCVRLTPALWYPSWAVWTFLVSYACCVFYFLSIRSIDWFDGFIKKSIYQKFWIDRFYLSRNFSILIFKAGWVYLLHFFA